MSTRNKGKGRIWTLLTLFGVLLVFWLYAMGFSFVGLVKGLTYSTTKLQTPNPTSYVFHAPVKQIRSVLPHWGSDQPCPPAPTPCVTLDSPTDGTTYDLWQLDRTTSDVYRWFGTPLEYRSNYTLTVTPVSDNQTRIDVRAYDSTVLLATKDGVHGGDRVDRVAPTTIEEYRFLLAVGNAVGEKEMPLLHLP